MKMIESSSSKVRKAEVWVTEQERKLIETITPLMPPRLWGTAEEAIERQSKQGVMNGLSYTLIIALALKQWRLDHSGYTEREEAKAYLSFVCISTGELGGQNKQMIGYYVTAAKPSFDIIEQQRLALKDEIALTRNIVPILFRNKN